MRNLVCGMPVGPDEERGVKFAINAIETSIKNTCRTLSTTWNVMLDPLVDSELTRKKFKDLFGDRVRFCTFQNEKNVVRDSNKCGNIHGSLLDELISTANSEYFCIHDSDVVFLKKDWDRYLVDLFESNEKLIAVGPESPLSDGWRGIPTSMILAIRVSEFKNLDIVLNKNKSSLGRFPNAGTPRGGFVVVDEMNQKYWSREVGTKVYLETGYELVPALIESGKEWITLRTDLHEDKTQWYYADDELFATHMTGSFVRTWDSEVRKNWSKMIDKIMEARQ